MSSIKDFLAKYGITTHAMVAAWLSLCGLYAEDQTVHNYVNSTAISIYHTMPHWLEALIAGLIIPAIAFYRPGLSNYGKASLSKPASKIITTDTSAKVVAILMAVMLVPATLPLAGCGVSAAQIQADGSAVAQAIESIAALETQQGNSALAQQLTSAAQALQAATSNFQLGNSTAIINDAATALEVALAAIPATAVYAPLIPIAVAAIDTLIGSLGGSAAPSTAPTVTNPEVALKIAKLHAAGVGLVHHRMMRSIEGDFKAAWNKQVKASHLPPTLVVK